MPPHPIPGFLSRASGPQSELQARGGFSIPQESPIPRSPTLKTGSFALEWARQRGCTELGEEVPPTETRLTPPTRLHRAIAPPPPKQPPQSIVAPAAALGARAATLCVSTG